ncbi:MAG: phage portal protein, partial [Anaerolineales bacterium]|nr:phage portal protein [Anaerolineales bacterium]
IVATDLETAFKALDGKQSDYDKLWDYYDGDQPLVYSASRLQDLFRDVDAQFTQNWCAVVVDSVLDRLNLGRFEVADNVRATEILNNLWLTTEMGLDSDDAHLAALVTGEAFVIVWRKGSEPVQAYYNDPRLCHIQYEDENPRVKKWAAKWWQLSDETWRLTL